MSPSEVVVTTKSGTTVKTDYVLVLIGEGNHTKKLAINPKSGKPEFVNMQLSDINELKGNNYVAKVFLELSFDMRAYPSLASSPFSIRYKINTIAYKKSLGSKGLNVGVSDIDVTGFGEVDADATDVESVQNELALLKVYNIQKKIRKSGATSCSQAC